MSETSLNVRLPDGALPEGPSAWRATPFAFAAPARHGAAGPADGHTGATLAEHVLARLRWLGGVYAHRLGEAIGMSFETLQPILERLVRQGVVVIRPEGTLAPGTVVMTTDEARRRGWLSEQKGG